MKMQKRLNQFLDLLSTYSAAHINFQVCKSVSHFNWFARYDTQNNEKSLPDTATENRQNQKR
jgi:hypothetical protein